MNATTLLIVDADVLVCTPVAEYLRECGYTVLEAANSKEALALLQSFANIHVALIDVGSPDTLDGFSLAQWIRRDRPEVKVALAAGVARTALAAGELCESGPLLRKPYHHRELERHIRQLLTNR